MYMLLNIFMARFSNFSCIVLYLFSLLDALFRSLSFNCFVWTLDNTLCSGLFSFNQLHRINSYPFFQPLFNVFQNLLPIFFQFEYGIMKTTWIYLQIKKISDYLIRVSVVRKQAIFIIYFHYLYKTPDVILMR